MFLSISAISTLDLEFAYGGSMGNIGRFLTAMVTPYTNDGEVDYTGARALARTLVEAGNDGVVVTGTTGESPLLNNDEKYRLWEEVKDELQESATVIAGAGTNDTSHSIELAKLAENAGVDAILAVTPYNLRPPQDGIILHFKKIAEASTLPVIVYNVPSRTGTNLTTETLVQLANTPNIIGNKEANGDLHSTAELMELAPSFKIWSGNDNDNFHLWCMGAWGAISVTGHIVAKQQKEMLEKVLSGDINGAATIHRRLVPLTNACFEYGNPTTIRGIMRYLGKPIGEPRLPILEPPKEKIEKVLIEIKKHELDSSYGSE